MYFSIPDTTERSSKRSSTQQTYTLFNIHVNELHHCSLRYSQLHKFNDELQRLYSSLLFNIRPFPPKKLFNLSLNETDERRLLLERYLQSIVQNQSLVSSSHVNKFFLNAQRETFSDFTVPKTIHLTIHLLNQHHISIENLSPEDSAIDLINACAKKMQIDQEYVPYFSLVFYQQTNNQLEIFRPLFSFESPYFSLIQASKIHENVCLVLTRSYWNVIYDLKLLDNQHTRNLLFLQAQYDLEQSKDYSPSDIHQQLDVLRNSSSSKEYILLARTSKFYGYILLRECSVSDQTNEQPFPCLLAIGNNELLCYSYDKETNVLQTDLVFKVTRIRCWKVNRTKQDWNVTFEYLIKKDTLQWISIHTKHAALVSTCLQSMVDEIIAIKAGATSPMAFPSAPNDRPNITNVLSTRTKSDLDRLNNNELFEKGGGDEDL